MPKLTQNFNIYPYFDDYDEADRYFRVLFRPGYSVQARELTQIQSILQNQIEKVGDTLYQDGSKVVGGDITLNTKINSLQIKFDYLGTEIDVTNFTNRVIEGQTSGARAEVVAVAQYTTREQNTLMINYVDDTLFLDDEVISTIDEGNAYFAEVAGADQSLQDSVSLVTSVSTKPGSVVSIDEGIFYIGGFFVYVPQQTIILDKYKNIPTYRIGLQINESIVSSIEDLDLLDNALGSPNYSAPGANRYKIDLVLSKKDFYEQGELVLPSGGTTFTVNPKDEKTGTVNITTATDHNLKVGDVVVVSGAVFNEYNGKHTISSIGSPTQFSYIIVGKPDSPDPGDVEYIKGIVDPIEKNSDIDFIELLRIENGEKTEEIKYPVIGDIEKTLARRTYDASGDFTVRPFSLNLTNHKIRGISLDRTIENVSPYIIGSGTNFIVDLNNNDTIFLSGNVNKTTTVSSIANATYAALSTGVSLGNGTQNQRLGVESKVTAELGPGKAYIKGYEYESVATEFLDVNKARDKRSVEQEKQGLEFGPFLKVTDLFANTIIDTGVNTSNGAASGAGMDLFDLHCVKWPATDLTSATSVTLNRIRHDSNGEIRYVSMDNSSALTIANTKIGTARLRQLDFRAGRSVTVDDVYVTNVSNPKTSKTMHRMFPAIFDAHMFEFRFEKYDGTVGQAQSNTQLITLDGTRFPIVNSLYGCTITVNTTFLGITSTDTRRIVEYTGSYNQLTPSDTFTAVLDEPLTQPTQSDSKFTIDFSVADIRSAVKTDTTGEIQGGFNIDVSGKRNGVEEGDTVLFDNNDDQRILLFPFQNKAISSTSNRKFKIKRTFSTQLTGVTAEISAPAGTGEKFYPGIEGQLTETMAADNYLVTMPGIGGEYIELSNASGTSVSAGRTVTIEDGGTTLKINVSSDHPSNTNFTYTSKDVHVVATMQVDAATFAQNNMGKKIINYGNTTVISVNSQTPTTTANLVQAQKGQIAFGLTINTVPGSTNSLKLADVKTLVAVIDTKDPGRNVTTTMLNSVISGRLSGSKSVYDITDSFSFDTGQRDNYYDYGTISIKPGEDKPVGQVMAIVDYYTHEGYGPFTVDSYIFSGTGNTPYAEIPSHISPITGQKYELRDVIDFRPKRIGIETANTDSISYTNNLAEDANVFHEKAMPDYDFTFDTDYEHYLPRKDKIAIGRDRQFKVIEGVPDLNPLLPPDDEDSMTLYTLDIPAYTFNPSDISIRYIDNKRYTMRDIGKLERRIENLEYYVSLSLLEKEADGLVITDSNNNDRFKNGILVDPFAGHNIGDVFNLDYKAAIDFDGKFLRPTFKSDAILFKYDSGDNSTLVNNSGIITLPFSANTFISQPFTGSLESKTVQRLSKINPFSIQSYMGVMKLDPFSDIWYDNSLKVDLKVNVEGQYDNWANIQSNNGHGTHWNDWEEIWSGKQINNEIKEGVRDTGDFATNDRKAKTTNQTKTLVGLKAGNVPEKILKTVGNKIVNLSIIPKVRAQKVTFLAQGLKPNKNVYAFFGDTRVTQMVKQASLITLSNVSSSNVFRTTAGNFEQITIQGSGANAGNTAKVVYMTDRDSQNGCSILVTDMSTESAFTLGSIIQGDDTFANGTVSSVTNYNYSDPSLSVLPDGVTAGTFDIPSGQFSGSDNLFRITDEPDNITSTTTSVAEAIYYTKGVLDTKNENGVLSTRPMIIKREDITDERVTRVTTDARQSVSTNWYNPMAQSFFIDKNQYPQGLFLNSVTLFFNRKISSVGQKLPVILQLRPMINGLPSSSQVVPGSEVVLTPGKITANTSVPVANSSGGFPEATIGNSSTANRSNLDIGSRTVFKFDHPIFLSPDEYAIVLITNSSQYQLYSFELGAKHTGTDRKITKQPYVGSFYKPSNSGIWERVIDQGLMFQVDRCEFTSANGYARFDNMPTTLSNTSSNTVIDSFKVNADTIEFNDTFVSYDYYVTDKDNDEKGAITRFIPNKTNDFKKQKQITYTVDSTNTQYSNSLQLNVYFETNNTLVSPVLDASRLAFFTVENQLNNGSLQNSDLVITSTGTGYDTDVNGNSSVFIVSSPDVGSNTAVLNGNVHANGSLNSVWVTSGGSGYITTPTVTVYDNGTAGDLASNVAGNEAAVSIIGEGAKAENMLVADSTQSSGGNMLSRYITRRVTLEEGFDAKDLRVYLNAYKPRGSDIHVYFKVLAEGDTESFDEKPYVLMVQETAESQYSLNPNEIKSFVYRTNEQFISYTNSSGTKFNNFKTFAIKIVFTLDREVQNTFIGIPKVSDIRVIALDSVGVP